MKRKASIGIIVLIIGLGLIGLGIWKTGSYSAPVKPAVTQQEVKDKLTGKPDDPAKAPSAPGKQNPELAASGPSHVLALFAVASTAGYSYRVIVQRRLNA